jgi:HD-GYP domain-containing protein (c-di-GMP phosphodiesterase class II)
VLELYHRNPFEPDSSWVGFLEALTGQAAIAIDNALMFEDLQRSREEIVRAYDATIEGWSRAMDVRDSDTEGHSRRVADMTVALGRLMLIPEDQLVHYRRGALLHDIGKLGVPDSILRKQGQLTDEEREIMRGHPAISYEMLSSIAFLRPALDIPYCHHEKWNGTGYPRGLKGSEIPLAARIFAVVDIWDALRSERPYRPAWTREQARDHIHSLSGSHLDSSVVAVFLEMQDDGSRAPEHSVHRGDDHITHHARIA